MTAANHDAEAVSATALALRSLMLASSAHDWDASDLLTELFSTGDVALYSLLHDGYVYLHGACVEATPKLLAARAGRMDCKVSTY